jgi:hypothetical protein
VGALLPQLALGALVAQVLLAPLSARVPVALLLLMALFLVLVARRAPQTEPEMPVLVVVPPVVEEAQVALLLLQVAQGRQAWFLWSGKNEHTTLLHGRYGH